MEDVTRVQVDQARALESTEVHLKDLMSLGKCAEVRITVFASQRVVRMREMDNLWSFKTSMRC